MIGFSELPSRWRERAIRIRDEGGPNSDGQAYAFEVCAENLDCSLWRDIETAPKDESSILLWDEDHGAGVCLWDKELQKWIKWWHPYDGPQYAAKATHWMPLPGAPE